MKDRANVNMNIKMEGHVIIPEMKAREFDLPDEYPVTSFKSYTIVLDGNEK
jgi:hypothetical protein